MFGVDNKEIKTRSMTSFLLSLLFEKLRKLIFISPEDLFSSSRYLGSRSFGVNGNISLTTF